MGKKATQLRKSSVENKDSVPQEDFNGLVNSLSAVMNELFTAMDACKVLEGENFDREVLQGYYNSASEIKDEILAINDKLDKLDRTKDGGLLALDYTELLSEVNQVETLTAALVHDTVSEMITLNIESSSDDLSKDLEDMEKLGMELMEGIKNEQ